MFLVNTKKRLTKSRSLSCQWRFSGGGTEYLSSGTSSYTVLVDGDRRMGSRNNSLASLTCSSTFLDSSSNDLNAVFSSFR